VGSLPRCCGTRGESLDGPSSLLSFSVSAGCACFFRQFCPLGFDPEPEPRFTVFPPVPECVGLSWSPHCDNGRLVFPPLFSPFAPQRSQSPQFEMNLPRTSVYQLATADLPGILAVVVCLISWSSGFLLCFRQPRGPFPARMLCISGADFAILWVGGSCWPVVRTSPLRSCFRVNAFARPSPPCRCQRSAHRFFRTSFFNLCTPSLPLALPCWVLCCLFSLHTGRLFFVSRCCPLVPNPQAVFGSPVFCPTRAAACFSTWVACGFAVPGIWSFFYLSSFFEHHF